MKKKIKFILWLFLIVILLGITTFVSLGLYTDYRLSKTYEVKPRMLAILTDSSDMAQGKRLSMLLCTHCHGGDLGGKLFFHDESLGDIYTPNLTAGKGGVGSSYTDEDWIRVIRHGVKKNKNPTLIMSSSSMKDMSDKDLGALIGYLKSIPPTDKPKGEDNIKFFTKVLISAGAFGEVISAEIIDHKNQTPIAEPNMGDPIAWGKYLAMFNGCHECHGKEYNGKKSPNPHAPFGANITMGGNLKNWDKVDFNQVLRTGKTPEGKQMNDEFMPFTAYAVFTDKEISALYMYLKSLPAKPTAEH